MATKYFNNSSSDGDWNNVFNWWDDDIHSIQSGAVPAPTDTARIEAACSTNNGPGAVCDFLAVVNSATFSIAIACNQFSVEFGSTIDASAVLTMAGGAAQSDVYGVCQATLNNAGTLIVQTGGSLSGNCSCATFLSRSGSDFQNPTITVGGSTAPATFEPSSGTFNGSLSASIATISGCTNRGNIVAAAITLNSASNYGSLTGATAFSTSSNNLADESNTGAVNGVCTFAGNSNNASVINGNCTFNDSSRNQSTGSINGDCALIGGASNAGGVSGTLTAPASDNGDGTWGYAPGSLGTFGTLKLTGIPSGGGGGSGGGDVFDVPV